MSFLISVILAMQPAFAVPIEEQQLLALEKNHLSLLSQKATGCQTICRKNPFSDSVTCEENCSAPGPGLCERSAANVMILGCLGGGFMAGLIGIGTKSALPYAAAGCIGLAGLMYLLRTTSNCETL